MFSPHVSIWGIKNWFAFRSFMFIWPFDYHKSYSAPLKNYVASLSDSTSLRVSIKNLSSLSFRWCFRLFFFFCFGNNSFYWWSVSSGRIERYQRSSRSFGMESMFICFFGSLINMQKDITPGPQLISISSVMITVNYCKLYWFFSSDSNCRPVRMDRYSKRWNGTLFSFVSFPNL